MKSIHIPIEVSPDIMMALNASEEELKAKFQKALALYLYQEGLLTFGKAAQFAGLSRYKFEKLLEQNNITLKGPNPYQLSEDLHKLNDL